MYNHFQLAKKYLQYYLTASNGKGHGVHSPFVFDFIERVLADQQEYAPYAAIESRRTMLENDPAVIEVEDFGAGSTTIHTNRRKVKDIARSSLKPKKYAQLLFRMVQHYQPATIVELGTSFGITTAYLRHGNPHAQLITCEGAESIAAIAQQTFDSLDLKDIKILRGDFAIALPVLFESVDPVDFVFIDGNHRKDPTIAYFKDFLRHATSETIFIFDDIHWSREMEAAWNIIKQHHAVTLTIDLFFIGIVLINPDFKVKQHFTIRF